jgi:hypothetical protein
MIDTLVAAVRNGELDGHLAEAAKQATPKKPCSSRATFRTLRKAARMEFLVEEDR